MRHNGSAVGLAAEEKRSFRRVLPHYAYYCFFHFLAGPVLGARGWARAKRRIYDGLILDRLLGGTKPPHADDWVLLLAGGLGEVRMAAKVAQELKDELNLPVYIFVQNRAGLQPNFPGISVGVSPFNNFFSAWLFLRRWKPRAMWAVEFWDNHHLKCLAAAQGIPTVVFNVPITESATQEVVEKPNTWWRWLPVGLYAVHDERHRERLRRFDIPDAQIRVTGPLAVGVPEPPEGAESMRARWRETFSIDDSTGPIIVAGSTWPEDEEAVLTAFFRVRESFPNARLIMAPRRGEGLDSTLVKLGVSFSRRSDVKFETPSSGVILLDSRGELRDVYSVADIAFVGGTYIPTLGGHTPTEALSWHVPMTTGPYFSQQISIIEYLQREGCLRVTQTVDELADVWLTLIRDREVQGEMAANAQRVMREQKGKIAAFFKSLDI